MQGTSMSNMGEFLSLSVATVICFHEVRNSWFKIQKNISFHLVFPSPSSGPLALQNWNLRNFQQSGVGIYFKFMAGPHYSFFYLTSGVFSLSIWGPFLFVFVFFLKKKSSFVLSMGSWSNAIALSPSLSKERATVFKRVQEALERSQAF